MKYAIATLSIFIICMGGCSSSELTSTRNEVLGEVTVVNDDIWYVDDRALFSYNTKKRIYDKVYCIQAYNNTLYFVADDGTETKQLYRYDEDVHPVCALPNGHYIKSIIHDDSVFCLSDNTIYSISMNNSYISEIELKPNIIDFCIDNDKLYYATGMYNNIPNSLDEYVSQLESGTENMSITYCIYEYDIKKHSNTMVYSYDTKTPNIYMSPLNGVVFYDPITKHILHYNNSNINTLYEGEIYSLLTDDKNVYFTSPDAILYMLNIDTSNIENICNGIFKLHGIANNNIYTGNGIFHTITP